MVIKNYKELCKIINIKYTNGYAKRKQLQELEQYVKYEKQGNAFHIKEVYPQKVLQQEYIPPRDMKYKNSKSIYSKYIQHILLQYFATESPDGIIYMSKIDIYKLLGLVNKKFGSSKAEKDFLNLFNNITSDELNVVKTQAFAKMNSILKTALNRLRSKRLISYFTVVSIQEKNGTCRQATNREIQKIDAIEHEVLNELNCSHIWQIYEKKLHTVFYDKVNEQLNNEGWLNTQRKLKIIFTNEYIIEEMNKLEIELEKMQLNEELMIFLQKDLEKKHEQFNTEHKAPAIGRNLSYENVIKQPENSLFIIPKQECMDKYNQIAENFIKYIMS